MILITGAAGFIGYHLAVARLKRGDTVLGLDNLNDYYDVSLKLARLESLKQYPNFTFEKLDLADRVEIPKLFERYEIKQVVNLAAQAGVRYSLENPLAYIDSNVLGFTNLIEASRRNKVESFVYASSSSVYGANQKQPLSEAHPVNHPLSIYAATKKCNELIAHSYSQLYNLPTTGLRFFTVYGPWGRPDMALFLFAKGILDGTPIELFNSGNMIRDFTYVDDIVEGISRSVDSPATPCPNWDPMAPDPATSYAPFRVYNIGNNKPTPLIDYISALEGALGRKAKLKNLPMQPGDVRATNADITRLEADLGYRPEIGIEEGISRFVDWYRSYYKLDSSEGNAS